jgi:polyphosphate glucokinase
MNVLGIDVGGSGIKGALVDLDSGELATERFKILTPEGFGLQDVSDTIGKIARHFDHNGPIGIGWPSAIDGGIVKSPPTAHHHPGWLGKNIAEHFGQATNCPVYMINDADAAGVAEMSFGAGQGKMGTVITITLGTGVGAGMFRDGLLIPNMEFGKLYLKGQDEYCEQYMAGRIKKEAGLTWEEYGQRLNEFLQHIEFLFSPSLVIIGGGISRKHEKYFSEINVSMPVVPAELRNEAGIVGAASFAAQVVAATA